MKTSSTVFYDSEKYKITKTTNGKFKIYDKKKRTTIGEFDTLRKATNSIKTVDMNETKLKWVEPESPKKRSKRKKK